MDEPSQPNYKPIDIYFDNVTLTTCAGGCPKEILCSLSGRFKCGELTAIMGPSGCGKSTFLNVLSGFLEKGVGGTIRANYRRKSGAIMAAAKIRKRKLTKSEIKDKSVTAPLTSASEESWPVGRIGFSKEDTCYIMQYDQLCPLFTVAETMLMAANLKRGDLSTTQRKLILIDEILETIGLTSCKNTRCVRLSGGQKKRLSIALELIDNPPIMYLDEPTTGLDSLSTSQCISILKSLARGGRNIVCTIHQPSASVFEMFDHVYVIAEGSCVYQGSCFNVVPYLQTIGLHCPQYHNPADFLLEVVNGEYGHFTSQLSAISNDSCWRTPIREVCYAHQVTSSNPPPPPIILASDVDLSTASTKKNYKRKPSEFYRLFVLMDRSGKKIYRDWTISQLKIVMHLLVGIFIGLLYSNCSQDGSKSIYNVGFLNVNLVYLSYTSLMPATLKFPSELHVLRKEQFNNWYQLKTYYAAFVIINVPIQILFCGVYCAAAYYFSAQVLIWSRFLGFMIFCQLVTLMSEIFGLILGTTLAPVNGVFVGAVATAFFILFAGYLCLFSHMRGILYYVSYLSYMRVAFEGLILSLYGFGREKLYCPLELGFCPYADPDYVINTLGVRESNYYPNMIALVVALFVFMIISFITLRRRIKSCQLRT